MPIGYARVEFVKRSEGKNAVAKSAYNSREKLGFDGNCVLDSKVYDFSYRENPSYHEVLLPEGVHENFKIAEVLWNAAEAKEKKINSQVAIDLVLALPDDEALNLEDRVKLAKEFVCQQVVSKGLAAQIDIHPPERKVLFTQDYELLNILKGQQGVVTKEKNGLLWIKPQGKGSKEFMLDSGRFNGFQIKEHNWHAHVLVTTRRFKSEGMEFEDHKPRELLPQVRKGRVVSGVDWGKLWTDHQNKFFKDRGMALRVDATGIVPQEHLGPVRMRGRAFDLLEEHNRIKELNHEISQSPKEILKKVTERLSVFTKDDVDRFFEKHVQSKDYQTLKEMFWQQNNITQLVDKETGHVVPKFSTHEVIEEERSIIRIADRIQVKEALTLKRSEKSQGGLGLTQEQQAAYANITAGKRLSCIQGYAGAGKSYLLSALAETYQNSGYYVRAFGPDNATCDVLKEKGFKNSENIMRFLFGVRHEKRHIRPDSEVWICDEAGKLGNKALLEFLKYAEANKAQLIFAGDTKQLTAVNRGGMFKVFNERYGAEMLQDIQRQKDQDQRQVSIDLSQQKVFSAINSLAVLNGFQWAETRKQSMEDLMLQWAVDANSNHEDSQLILAHTNDEVRVLNELARSIKKARGELREKEILCETSLGRVFVGEGDKIEFRKNDKLLGVTNGLTGKIIQVDEGCISVAIQKDKKNTQIISFNPSTYRAFQLGYATTYFRAQGATVDKAYILHSPHINRELFYVALTRHTKQARYYLSKEEVPNLAFLKKLAVRESGKDTTLAYSYEEEARSIAAKEESKQKIEQLKKSDLVLDRLKGFGISTWHLFKEKAIASKEFIEDKRHDKSFYKTNIEIDKSKGKSIEVVPEFNKQELINHIKVYDDFNRIALGQRLSNQLQTDFGGSFFKNVISHTRYKNASLAEQANAYNILYYFRSTRIHGFQQKLSQLSDYSEKEKAEWAFQKEAANFINSEAKIRRSLVINPQLNAKGNVADHLTYQVLLFKAKLNREPTYGQIVLMKETIQNCEKTWSFSKEHLNDKALVSAKDLILEKICYKALAGNKIQQKELIAAKEDVLKEHQSFKSLEIQHLNLGKNIGLGRGEGFGISI